MAVVFDTATVPAKERGDGMRVALAETSVSSVVLLGDDEPVSARLDVWPYGDSYLFRAATSPVRMFRTERQARQEPVPLLALAVQEHGEGLHTQFAPMRRVRAGTMMGMDMTEPFEFAWSGQGASRALMMPLEELDVSAEALRHAVPRLGQSPLCELMRAHIVGLFDAADAVSAHPMAAEIASSSVDLAPAASNHRAFRRAHGMSPGQYRRLTASLNDGAPALETKAETAPVSPSAHHDLGHRLGPGECIGQRGCDGPPCARSTARPGSTRRWNSAKRSGDTRRL
jgi:AraC-like DNA-binding protein